MIYLDNTATSPVLPEVLDAMLPFLKEEYGNPSSKYYCKADNARKAVENARQQVAALLGADPESVIFTAGATESTNFIIKGYLDYRKYYVDGKNHIITSTVEHKATLNTCKYLNGDIYSNSDPSVSLFNDRPKVDRGFEATFVNPTTTGEITAESIIAAVNDNTAMVSVICVNNEIGTISDVQSIAGLCHDEGIAFHSDLTQAIGKIRIDVRKMGIDYASCSAHKINGPKGIGAAIVKTDSYGIEPISAFMHGGEQENGFRAGTLAVHNIVGFGKAAEIAYRDFDKNSKIISELDAFTVNELLKNEKILLTNPDSNRQKGIISIIIDKKNFNNELFIKEISNDFAISTGSACSAGEPSYVLGAIGLKDKVTKVLRISLSKTTTKEDITRLVEEINKRI